MATALSVQTELRALEPTLQAALQALENRLNATDQATTNMEITVTGRLSEFRREFTEEQSRVVDAASLRFAEIGRKSDNFTNDAQRAINEIRQQLSDQQATAQKIINDCQETFQQASVEILDIKKRLHDIDVHLQGHPPTDWHQVSERAITDLKARIERLEGSAAGPPARDGGSAKRRGFISEEDMKPDNYDGDLSRFRKWR